MTDLRLHDEDEVTHGLRALYAAPAGAAYWSDMESRIMARVAEVELGWWDELDRWMRPALVAAAVLVVTAGVAMFRAQQTEADLAYRALLSPSPISSPMDTVAAPPIQPDRKDAALRTILPR
jgi:hypothetical protein